MTDLTLQDFESLTNEGLVQTLTNEKKEMFGEQRVPAKNRAVHRLCPRAFARSFMHIKKGGARNATD